MNNTAICGIPALKRKIELISMDTSISNPSLVIYELITHCLDTHAITQEEFLEAFHEDNNLINLPIAELLVEHGYISSFSSFGFKEAELYPLLSAKHSSITDFRSPSFQIEIPMGERTEVYFWGLPNSGINTILAAILNVARNGRYARSMSMDPNSQSYGYMAYLANVFNNSDHICVFPTKASRNYSNNICLDFDLEDNRGSIHPISFIKMASAALEVVFKKECGDTLSSDVEHYIDDLLAVLTSKRTRNKKIHFFIIEYCKEPRDYSGLSQSSYLESALNYLERAGVFLNDTDRLELIITKVDRAKVTGKQLQEVLREYILEHFQSFYFHLRKICKENEINRGNVEICPFSIGQVYLQDYFHFDERCAAKLVSLLLDITVTSNCQNNWLERIKERLKRGF